MTEQACAHVRWHHRPALRQPTMIAAFTGWNDAGDAASNGVQRMIEAWNATPLGEIDPEEFTDFATVRPHVRLTPQRTRTIIWPTVGLWSASTPGGDVILALGPEPALRWRLFCEQLVGVAQTFGVPLVITLGALLADVPHTRPVRVIGTASSQHVIQRFDLQESRYQGPTGIVGVLHHACAAADIPSASLWAAVPAYAAQVPSPSASMALLQQVSTMVGSPPPTAALSVEAADYASHVTRLIEDDPDLRTYVERLESMFDEGSLDADFDADFDDQLGPQADDDTDDEFDDDFEDDLDDSLDDDLAGEDLADPLDDADLRPGGQPGRQPSPGAGSPDDLVAEVERFLRDQNG